MRKRTKSKAPPETDTIYPKKQRKQKKQEEEVAENARRRPREVTDEERGGAKKGEIRGAKDAEVIAEVSEGPKAGGNPQLHSRHVGGGVIRMHPCLKAQWRECARQTNKQ